MVFDHCGDLGDLVFVGDVKAVKRNVAPGVVGYPPSDRDSSLGLDIGDDHAGTMKRIQRRNTQPDALRTAGDDRDLPAERQRTMMFVVAHVRLAQPQR